MSRLHAKSTSLKWSICRSVLFKLMVTLNCCVWSSVIGECAGIFLKVDVFCFPSCSCQEISREYVFLYVFSCGEVLFLSHCLVCFHLSCNWFVPSIYWISAAIKAKVSGRRFLLNLQNMEVQKSWWLTYSSFFNECVWSGSRSRKGSPLTWHSHTDSVPESGSLHMLALSDS